MDKKAALGKFDAMISELMAKKLNQPSAPDMSPEHEQAESPEAELAEHLTGQEAQDEPQDLESPEEDIQEGGIEEEGELPPHIQKLLEKALMMSTRRPHGEMNMGQIGASRPGGISIQKEVVKVLPKKPLK